MSCSEERRNSRGEKGMTKQLILSIGEWKDDKTFQPERMWNLEDMTEEQKKAMLEVILQFGFNSVLKVKP